MQRPLFSPLLSLPSRSFTNSAQQYARVSESSDLTFPKSKHPTPFEIFHFTLTEPLNQKIVKMRYYELSKLYHPDTKQSTSAVKDTSKEFKMITEAYNVLKDSSKRNIYLRSGYGWTSKSPRPPGAKQGQGFDFSRGPPMRNGGPGSGRGAYPSHAYDSAYWTDPFNPHYRPDASGGGPGMEMGGGTAAGWSAKGFLGTNGAIFLSILSLTLIITPLSFYTIVPPSALDSAYSDSEWGSGRDKRHYDAARALTAAREAARDGGLAKRAAMAQRVKEIERHRAYERAIEVQRIEREGGTGHVSLPAPSNRSA